MGSLFSIFDPSSKIVSNWVICLILIVIKTKIPSSQFTNLVSSFISLFMQEMKIIKIHLFFFLLPIFIVIFIFNISGILPFTFTLTSHMSMTFSLAFPMWLSLMVMGWLKYNNMFAHLVPLGCPTALMPFMVLIETISLVIRPLTLAVRLAANMIAGHMILSLISMSAFNSSAVFLSSLFVESAILILELAVAMIQPYVFFILLTLYSQEVE
uniref:ATP synthase subunit a n=1 Tax=Liposcelis bostrychophila TaxID=185214 RepID=A0A3Q8BYB4_LIPBO|nr:ATP synthase F0 subunit 6 [Liposcelis bostrychophila]ATU74570.1 ATP synthase F0 subunit 6 [Liposcelis bostrychophila]UNO31836.1 ATP synthase F0 subunit 6 [Liposcelis bostrychophila]